MYRKRTGRSSITWSLPQRIYRIFLISERSTAISGIQRSMSLKPISVESIRRSGMRSQGMTGMRRAFLSTRTITIFMTGFPNRSFASWKRYCQMKSGWGSMRRRLKRLIALMQLRTSSMSLWMTKAFQGDLSEGSGSPITQGKRNCLRRQRLKRRISVLLMMTWVKEVQRKSSVTISGRLQP